MLYFHFTASKDKVPVEALLEFLDDNAEQYTFQPEIAPSGYRHFQGCCKVKKPIRLSTLIKACQSSHMKTVHWSIASTNGVRTGGGTSYCCKADTREPGGFVYSHYQNMNPSKTSHVPEQAAIIEKWGKSSFQDFVEWTIVRNTRMRKSKHGPRGSRHINVLYDPTGCRGKSTLSTYLHYKGIATRCPPFTCAEDMLAFVCSWKSTTRDAYILDIPRSLQPSEDTGSKPDKIRRNKMSGFYAGLEAIKDGYAYDKRYKGDIAVFDSPTVWVFTNQPVDYHHLSPDRWLVWTIDDTGRACPHDDATRRYYTGIAGEDECRHLRWLQSLEKAHHRRMVAMAPFLIHVCRTWWKKVHVGKARDMIFCCAQSARIHMYRKVDIRTAVAQCERISYNLPQALAVAQTELLVRIDVPKRDVVPACIQAHTCMEVVSNAVTPHSPSAGKSLKRSASTELRLVSYNVKKERETESIDSEGERGSSITAKRSPVP